MALKLFKFGLFLIFLNISLAVIGQQPSQTPSRTTPLPQWERDRQERKQRDDGFQRLKSIDLMVERNTSQPVPSEPSDFGLTQKDLDAIAIDPKDIANFTEFLKQPDTGVFRLHDFSNCQSMKNPNVFDFKGPCPLNLPGRGASYSVSAIDYVNSTVADIIFENSSFHIRRFNTLAFLTDLGDTALSDLSATTNGIKEMADFEPSDKLEIAKKQILIAQKGFQVGNFIYKTSLLVKENTTYAFRSIIYQIRPDTGEIKKDSDKITGDMIVVFRVIRKHADGSVSIYGRNSRVKTRR